MLSAFLIPKERTVYLESEVLKMTRCYFCGASDIKIPNSKITIKGKKNGNRVQKTIRICNYCGAWKTDEEICQEISETFGWD